MICGSCGKEIVDDARWCPMCGTGIPEELRMPMTEERNEPGTVYPEAVRPEPVRTEHAEYRRPTPPPVETYMGRADGFMMPPMPPMYPDRRAYSSTAAWFGTMKVLLWVIFGGFCAVGLLSCVTLALRSGVLAVVSLLVWVLLGSVPLVIGRLLINMSEDMHRCAKYGKRISDMLKNR